MYEMRINTQNKKVCTKRQKLDGAVDVRIFQESLYNKKLASINICTIGLKPKAFEDMYLPSPERTGGAYFYTSTNEMHTSLKDPNAIIIFQI